MRDIVAFLYLFIPVFTADLFIKNQRRATALISTIFLMAVLFSLRGALEYNNSLALVMLAQLIDIKAQAYSYFANAPTLLFTAGLSYALALRLFLNSPYKPIPTLCLIGILIACTIIPITAFAATFQRATLAGFIVIAITAHGLWVRRAPIKGSLALLCLACMTIGIYHHVPSVQDISLALQTKTSVHGLNHRAEEWQQVFAILLQDWPSFLFGQGWGGSFYSYTTGGQYVNFTHSLISALLLKTGIVGLGIISLYGAHIARALITLLPKMPIIALCIAIPIAIDVTLYGSYKSLDFGVMLLMIIALSASDDKLPEDKAKSAALLPC